MNKVQLSIGFLAALCLSCSAIAYGPATQCNELPDNFKQIKTNLESHLKAMTDLEIELAITDLTSFNGRSFRRRHADLARDLQSDISDWNETARRCSAINPDGLYEEERTCEKVSSDIDAKWRSKIASAQDKNRMRDASWAIRAREKAKCFVSFESKLFSPYRNYTRLKFPTTTFAITKFPYPITVPADFLDATKEILPNLEPKRGQVFCNPADRDITISQLRGERISDSMTKGCVSIGIDDKVKIDMSTGMLKFSSEDDIKGLITTSPSANPQIRLLESRRVGLGGHPTHRYAYEIRDNAQKITWSVLNLFDGERVWAVTYSYSNLCHEALCESIWDTLIEGFAPQR